MTKKSISKRIRVTRTGKLMRRPMGVGHFRAKRSGAQTRAKRRTQTFASVDIRSVARY